MGTGVNSYMFCLIQRLPVHIPTSLFGAVARFSVHRPQRRFTSPSCLIASVLGGTEFRTGPYLHLGASYLASGVLRGGPIKTGGRASGPFAAAAATAEDGQHAARRGEALLRDLLPAPPQHGR